MAKYVYLWETDLSKSPADPKEMSALTTKYLEMLKQWLKDNPGSEWGGFIEEPKGYMIGGKTPQDTMKLTGMFAPYIKFKVYQAVSVNEFEEVVKSTPFITQQK